MKSTLMRTPVLCLSLTVLAACGGGKQPPPPPTPTVGVVTVQPQSVPLTKDLVGRLSAYRSADVRARVSGLLLKRVYTEGAEVKAGQLMFQIDPAPYKAALDATLATLASAQATYTNAHIVAERDRALVPKGYISKAQLDSDEANERSSAAAVKQAEANVQTARVNLSYTNITSPIAGHSGEQQVTEGAIVGTGTTDSGSSSTLLTTVNQLDPMYVNFTVSAADMDALTHAQSTGSVNLSEQDKTVVQVKMPGGSNYDQPARAGAESAASLAAGPVRHADNRHGAPQQRVSGTAGCGAARCRRRIRADRRTGRQGGPKAHHGRHDERPELGCPHRPCRGRPGDRIGHSGRQAGWPGQGPTVAA